MTRSRNLLSEYIETGKVRFVYRDYPRGFGNPLRAADAARCAGEQNAYWPMHDRLFNSDGQFSAENLNQFAAELKLEQGQFSKCIEDHKYFSDIEKDLKDAGSLGHPWDTGLCPVPHTSTRRTQSYFDPRGLSLRNI